MFLVPIESGRDRAESRIASDDTVEIRRISFSFHQPFPTTVRAAREIRAGAPAIEPTGNRLSGDRSDMHSSKQVIILLGLIIECPAAVEKVALMPSVGKRDRKAAAGQKAVELSQGAPLFVACLGLAYAEAGYWKEAQKILGQLNEISKQRYVTPYVLARIYAALGKKDEALGWLETGYRERAALMVCLKTDQRFDELRSDPRFQDLLRRMNFPP